MNNVTIVGNVGQEPDLRYTPSGAAVCKFSVAVNRKWSDRSGEKQEETTWFNVVAWQALAENIAESISIGTRVIVSGRMQSRVWEKDDGTKQTLWDLSAYAVGPDLSWATAAVTKTQRSDWQSEIQEPVA